MQFFVEGTPAPKGSFRVVTQRRGRLLRHPQVLKDSQRTYAWEKAVAWHSQAARAGDPLDVPLSVDLLFLLERPKSHLKKNGEVKSSAPAFPAVAPDIDKLARATLDGMEGAIFTNDSRVVDLSVRKRYAKPGGRTGCLIRVVETPCP